VTETLLLTHTDLDGVGCGVLFTGARPGQGTVELVDNGKIDARVREALEHTPAILVTDHGVDAETADQVDAYIAAGGHFTLLDHHRSSQHLAARQWATIDETRSATGLLFDHLGEPTAYAEFARLVEDHDLWRHSDPRSARLAALVGLLGHERFLARFTANPRVEFGEGEILLLDNEDSRREDYLAKKLEQATVFERGGVRWAVCYAEQYQSDVAERLMTELGVAATAIVNPARRTVSLRGRDFDVSAVAQRHGGGGHARAAAFTFRGGELEKDLERFEAELENLLAGG
jgi:oligoribonuclease NrnB/cAMP/cGMP phosphodiesterase (DHH superfamily)